MPERQQDRPSEMIGISFFTIKQNSSYFSDVGINRRDLPRNQGRLKWNQGDSSDRFHFESFSPDSKHNCPVFITTLIARKGYPIISGWSGTAHPVSSTGIHTISGVSVCFIRSPVCWCSYRFSWLWSCLFSTFISRIRFLSSFFHLWPYFLCCFRCWLQISPLFPRSFWSVQPYWDIPYWSVMELFPFWGIYCLALPAWPLSFSSIRKNG